MVIYYDSNLSITFRNRSHCLSLKFSPSSLHGCSDGQGEKKSAATASIASERWRLSANPALLYILRLLLLLLFLSLLLLLLRLFRKTRSWVFSLSLSLSFLNLALVVVSQSVSQCAFVGLSVETHVHSYTPPGIVYSSLLLLFRHMIALLLTKKTTTRPEKHIKSQCIFILPKKSVHRWEEQFCENEARRKIDTARKDEEEEFANLWTSESARGKKLRRGLTVRLERK